MTSLITLNPIDPGVDARVTVRLCATQDPADTGADGQIWWPAIIGQPTIQTRLFDGDFTSGVDSGSGAIEVDLGVLLRSGAFARVERYDWAGATATIQRRNGGTLQTLAVMKVDSFASSARQLSLRLAADGELFDVDVLSATYAGTGGAEGGADIEGRVKPWVFGRALNVEPVFIDQIDNVFQVNGYGPVQAISAVYERGASFGASVGNFADYTALVAASIPEGRWGTSLAQGLIRLGAPPAGVITCDVDGDNGGGFLRRTGAILQRIASQRGLSASVNATSLAALDTAVPRNVNISITEQTTFMDLVQRMVAPCNAVPGIAADGSLIVSRVVFGSEQFTLDVQGRQMPPVLGATRQNTSAPYKRIQMGAARSWRVHSFDEIAFFADLIDRGLYVGGEIYREGNIVESADKARWVYVNPTASSGNAPPTWPTTSNAYWQNIAPPIGGDLIGGIVAPANANRVPFSRFEGGRGWAVLQSSFAAHGPVFAVADGGRTYIGIEATASAANQNIFLGNAPRFAVVAGERLSVSSIIRVTANSGPAPNFYRFDIEWFDSSGTILPSTPRTTIASGGGAAVDLFRADFVTVPAGAVAAQLSLRAESAGAGSLTVRFMSPMVAGAAAGQTVHPPYAPGANADDGANLTAPADANRVPLSRMEGDTGYGVLFNPAGLTAPTDYGIFEGMRFFRAQATATASGQQISIGSAPSTAAAFRLTPSERVSVQARVEAQGPAATGGAWVLALWGFLPDGTQSLSVIGTVSGSAPRVIGNDHVQFFADVPSNIVGGRLELYATSGGAGLLQVVISEPMVTSAAAGQTVHPPFSPGPVLTGPVLAGGPLFIGQLPAPRVEYGTGDTVEDLKPAEAGSDVTATAQRSVVPQFPIVEIRQGEAGHTGNRTVLHTARRGTETLVGGTYSLPNINLGTGSATINGSTGTVTLSSITQSGSYTVRYTHTDTIPTDAVVNLTYIPAPVVAGSPSDSTGGLLPISGSGFVVVTPRNLEITLPSGVTTATLTAAGVALDLIPELPLGATGVEMRWMRESSPGTWTAVGSVATASPAPEAVDSGFTDSFGQPIATGQQGTVTCNRSATGLSAGSVQKFRLEARISSGNIRTVLISGTAIATS